MQEYEVNQALMCPLLIFGVERRLFLANGFLTFLLIAAGHAQCVPCLIGGVVFISLHSLAKVLTYKDPFTALIWKRSLIYQGQDIFPAVSSLQVKCCLKPQTVMVA